MNKRSAPEQVISERKQGFIELKGVATNNLKSIDVRIPLHQLTSVTGVSGSGKSSLVFDTLYAEAYRRYVESLSSFARQYLKALPKPVIDSVKHLPPAIAVRQTRSGANNRSTVGTLTEMHDTLRVLYAQASELYCTKCERKIQKADPDMIAQFATGSLSGKKILVTAPVAAWDALELKELKPLLLGQGFTRVWIAGAVHRIEDLKSLKPEDTYIVVDRITVEEESRKRLAEASALALRLGRGDAHLIEDTGRMHSFSKRLRCCGIDYVEPSLALFSFNHPLGACSKCQGFGNMTIVDQDKAIPNRNESLASHGVAPWNFGEHTVCYDEAYRCMTYLKMNSALKKKPFKDYTADEWHWLWHGDGKKYTGIYGYFTWLDTKRYKAHYRIHAARFRKYVICDQCDGKRLNDKALACRVLGLNIAEVNKKDVGDLIAWVDELEKTSKPKAGSTLGIAEALTEAKTRLSYLQHMGLGYLAMDRAAPTLSGGELQRINMSRCLGSILTETLFCLDEPTAGLHARDSQNLLGVVRDLQRMGNTVVVVEHERTIIEGSDHFIEIGPKAGHEGGYVVFAGPPDKRPRPAFKHKESEKASQSNVFIEIKNASVHNLKNVSAKIPVGKVTAVCGVSGSGKTSLIKHTLYPLLERYFTKSAEQDEDAVRELKLASGSVGPEPVIRRHDGVMLVSQVALGRSSRSTIGTYLGLMDEIRKILASTDDAVRLKLTPGSFSFNVAGGRCETCRGLGTVVEDLSFLGDMEIVCPTCNGRRFQERVLAVRYNGKNLIDILALTVAEARQFFFDKPAIAANLDAVLDVGMGYVTLGQHTSSFSGGEAQRLKLVQIMRDAKKGKPSILIFDEPTTGLSDRDTEKLMDQFELLASKGHTVIVVEHHLDVLRRVDWLIEMGPEASVNGGEVVYQGIPAGIGAVTRSKTAPYLVENSASVH